MRSPMRGRVALAVCLSIQATAIVLAAAVTIGPVTGSMALPAGAAEAWAAGEAVVFGASVDRAPARARYGKEVAVTGAVHPLEADVEVRLERRSRRGWRTVDRATTSSHGRYRLLARATTNARVRVRPAGGVPTAPRSLRVAASLRARASRDTLWLGQRAVLRGRVRPAGAGRVVRLERRRGDRWTAVARARTGAAGRFRIKWRPASAGVYPLRVRFAGDARNAQTKRRVRRVGAFRPGGASYYGPGGRTACGQSLGAGTMGVAHRTLPCGTMVTLYYGGRTVRVPVIDRGPFVAGRDWDLTIATKSALGFGSTGTVGAAW